MKQPTAIKLGLDVAIKVKATRPLTDGSFEFIPAIIFQSKDRDLVAKNEAILRKMLGDDNVITEEWDTTGEWTIQEKTQEIPEISGDDATKATDEIMEQLQQNFERTDRAFIHCMLISAIAKYHGTEDSLEDIWPLIRIRDGK